MGTMLILRGIKNLLHVEPALEFAIKSGYTPEVLDASGETGIHSDQVNKAIARIQAGDISASLDYKVTALYGFSGGGYNCRWIWARLNDEHKAQIRKIVVLGAPGITGDDFPDELATLDLTIYNNESVEHMDQPDDFLKHSFPDVS